MREEGFEKVYRVCGEATISFKSNEQFYYKEMSGRKNNTVRIIDSLKDPRLPELQKKIQHPEYPLMIDIWKVDEDGSMNMAFRFSRRVRDVSYYSGAYIITWEV